MRAALLPYMVLVAACVTTPSIRPYAGTLPPDTRVNMAGVFMLLATGELQLALAQPCEVEVRSLNAHSDCDRTQLEQIKVIAHTPWNQDIRGTWRDAQHIAFQLDWKATGLDPLADSAPATVARPWTISGTEWRPSAAEGPAILKMISDATGTETELVRGGSPPKLEVAAFAFEGDALQIGHPNQLVVRIANHGAGAAYRVTATTRSSVEALHGLRMSFGTIMPGADKIRKVQVVVPASETARDTMLVLEVSEGNGAAPGSVSRRIPVAPSTSAPALAMRCEIMGHKGERPDLDVGQPLAARCTVDNTGDADAPEVEVEVSVAGDAPARSAAQAVPRSGHRMFSVSFTVPRELPIDAPVEIAITARDRPSSRTVRTTITGVVHKPKLCERGALTRSQYRAKVKELHAALAAGGITQAEFDRYDAELVACLK